MKEIHVVKLVQLYRKLQRSLYFRHDMIPRITCQKRRKTMSTRRKQTSSKTCSQWFFPIIWLWNMTHVWVQWPKYRHLLWIFSQSALNVWEMNMTSSAGRCSRSLTLYPSYYGMLWADLRSAAINITVSPQVHCYHYLYNQEYEPCTVYFCFNGFISSYQILIKMFWIKKVTMLKNAESDVGVSNSFTVIGKLTTNSVSVATNYHCSLFHAHIVVFCYLPSQKFKKGLWASPVLLSSKEQTKTLRSLLSGGSQSGDLELNTPSFAPKQSSARLWRHTGGVHINNLIK